MEMNTSRNDANIIVSRIGSHRCGVKQQQRQQMSRFQRKTSSFDHDFSYRRGEKRSTNVNFASQ